MNKNNLSRKLAVILHADVVGSTSLVQRNETLAHKRIQAAFRQFSETIVVYGGIAHELRGDAIVAEFERASDAVAASLAFQIQNAALNTTLDDDIRPELRIGISLGEVVIADGTITGAGVVLAQRLEQLAEPGGIVVQGAVSETVPTRMPYNFESLGEQMLKGFDQPVRAFAARLKQGEALPLVEVNETASIAQPVGDSASEKPSIAVLPFANMSNDPDQEYFADGIAEDIITALSHIKQWFVIARNSSFAYKGRHVDIREIARELGVRYILEGSVRKGGNRLRITGQLIEAETGTHLWADRYDGDLEDVFALQDRITESVVGAIEPSLRLAEIARSKRKLPKDIGAYDLYLQALPHLFAIRPEPNERALNLLHQAIELDPNYAPALAYLAWAYEERVTRAWGDYGNDDAGAAVALARRAIAADRDDALVLVVAGFVLVMIARDYNQGLEAVNRARELNPNIAFVSFLVGAALNICGNPEEGLTCIEDAIRVSPGDPGAFFFFSSAAMAHLMCGRPDQACNLATKSARIYPGWDTTYRVLAPALVQLGRMEEARSAVAKLLELSPTVTVSRLRLLWPIRNPEHLDMILDGLRIAGLPE
ncbi:MAG: adenylate/guanylate cyclase domain-containing protein [Gammaproteobacteria bacterium]